MELSSDIFLNIYIYIREASRKGRVREYPEMSKVCVLYEFVDPSIYLYISLNFFIFNNSISLVQELSLNFITFQSLV